MNFCFSYELLHQAQAVKDLYTEGQREGCLNVDKAQSYKGTPAAAALFVSHTIHNAYTAINLNAAESDSTNSVGKDYLARLV